MKILVISDTHREFGKLERFPEFPVASNYDLVVLAGDIDVGTRGLEWAIKQFPSEKPILYVPGNHEYYRNDYNTLQDELAALAAQHSNVVLMNPGAAVIDNVVFIGGTMWSNLVYEGIQPDAVTKWKMDRGISDFRVISNGSVRFSVEDMITECEKEIAYFDRYLHEYTEAGKTVVMVTHFLPSALCTAPQFVGSGLNPYFASDQDWLMSKYNIPLWIYGHTHTPTDIIHPTGTRLFCNPFGYPNESSEPFEWQIVEV